MTFLTSTPLLDIERSVQKLAQEAEVDISMPDNRDRLITMIHAEMDRWQESNRSHFLSDENRQIISSRIEANIAGYGPLQALLDDDSVWEVMINAHDSIFVRRHGKPTTYYNGSFHDPLTRSHDRYKTEVIEPKGTPGTAFQIEFEMIPGLSGTTK